MSRSKQKGNKFERDICKKLSLWWSNDDRDDIFWRSQTSGGRATQRAAKGKHTFGQSGDIAAVDPIGQPLIDLLTIELKKGYNKETFQDLFDRLPTLKGKCQWEKWVEQAATAHTHSGSFSWLLVTSRNNRQTLCATPFHALQEMSGGWRNHPPLPHCLLEIRSELIIIILFDVWLSLLKPERLSKLRL